MPTRVLHRRGVALPPGAKLVARPTRWGNPYVFESKHVKPGRILVADRATAVAHYAADLRADPDRVAEARRALAGYDLACSCPLDGPCHADVLLALANDTG